MKKYSVPNERPFGSTQGQRGAILPILVVLLLIAGILVTTGLVKVPQIFKPKASGKAVEFFGTGVIEKAGQKTTKDITAWVSIQSPFGGPIETSGGRGAQSVEQKGEDFKKRVLLPLWDQLTTVKEALAQTNEFYPNPTSGSKVLSGWEEVTPLPKGYDAGGAVTNGNYIFVAGGNQKDASQPTSEISQTIYSVKINSDGTLGEWRSDLPVLPAGSAASQGMFLFNGYIYLVGGENNSRSAAEVYSAKVDGGSISEWKKVNTLPVGVSRHGLISGNSYLYVIGGYHADDPNVRVSDVYVAKFASDGTLGEWNKTTSLPKGLSSIGVVDIYTDNGPYIFVAGGLEGGDVSGNNNPYGVSSDKVYSSKVNSDGSLGEWKEVGKLKTGLAASALTSNSGNLILVGGSIIADNPEGSYLTSYSQSFVYSAKVNKDGSIGDWVAQDSLPTGLAFHSLVNTKSFNKNDLYVIGGLNSEQVYNQFVQPNVYRAKLISNFPPTNYPVSTHPKNVKLDSCQTDTATVSWDEVSGANSYWAEINNLTYNDNSDVKQTLGMPIPAGGGKFEIPIKTGNIYDITIKSPKEVYFQSEHIAVVCGVEDKEGTAAFRTYASSADQLTKTPFHLYNGTYNFPYPLKFTSEPQFIFAEFVNYKNESKIASDSIIYTGPIPTYSPPPTPVGYPAYTPAPYPMPTPNSTSSTTMPNPDYNSPVPVPQSSSIPF